MSMRARSAAKRKVKASPRSRVKAGTAIRAIHAKAAAPSGGKRKPARRAVTADIQVRSPLWKAQPRATRIVRAAIAAASAHSTLGGEVSILLIDDSTVARLNREWRGIDKPTNVLSFPAPDLPASDGVRMLGDIVIAYETLQRECADEDRAFLHHLSHLTVHGFLHLIGYDHGNDAEAEAMEALESKIMTGMKLPDPWLEPWLGRDDEPRRSRKPGGA
jgi:probable rRNA maturation factor